MITCFKGNVTVRGESLTVLTEYIGITRTLFDILKHTYETREITDERKVACNLMAVIETALDGSKLSNRKEFYEVIETIAKHEKGESV